MIKNRLTDSEIEDIKMAVDVLRRGGVLLYPTDTVWGLGCDATNEEAVARIYKIKHRTESKALVTLVGDIAMLERTVDGIPDVAYDLIEMSERPTSIIYDKAVGVAPNLVGNDGTLAVRLTSESFSNALCRRFGKPIVSTSANISGEQTPLAFADISDEIVNNVDYVCKSRRNENKLVKPSVIMRLSADGQFKILRS